MSACGTSGLSTYGDCQQVGTEGWQRWATDEEIHYYHGTGDLPEYETECQITVVACAEHGIHPELAALVHDSACRQPAGANGCEACATPIPEPHEGEEVEPE